MTRALLTLLTALTGLLIGCGGGPMATPGDLIKTGGIQSTVGNPSIGSIRNPWLDFPGDLWGNTFFSGVVIEDDLAGDLIFTPISDDFEPSWFFESLRLFDLTDSGIYFRWRPIVGAAESAMTFDLRAVQTLIRVDITDATISFQIGDGSVPGSVFAEDTYDRIVHRWVRMKHDSGTGDITISTAEEGGGPWVEQLAYGSIPPGGIGALQVEVSGQTSEFPDGTELPGFLGIWAQQQRSELGFIASTIQPIPTPGLLTKTGIIRNTINE